MDRRTFLSGTMAGAVTALVPAAARSSSPGHVLEQSLDRIGLGDLRGSLPPPDPTPVANAADEQSSALQQAIDAAARDGRPLFLSPGRYEVSNLRLPERLSLVGVAGATRLVYGGGGVLMTAKGCRSLCLDGIVLDGSNRSLADDDGALVSLLDVEDLELSRVEILGSAGHGLALARCGGRLAGTKISGARGCGLVSTDARGLTVADGLFAGCGDGGVHVIRWSDATDGTVITRNRFEDLGAAASDGAAILIEGASDVAIDDNTLRDCAGIGIALRGTRRPRISGNGLRATARAAISLITPTGGSLTGNVIDEAAAGIVLEGDGRDDGPPSAISGNIVSRLAADPDDPRGTGIGIAVETGAALNGNSVDGAESAGIRLGWGPRSADAVASGNVVRRSAVGIGVSVVGGDGGAVVSANMIAGAGKGAICGLAYAEIATRDLASAAQAYPGLVIERNVVG